MTESQPGDSGQALAVEQRLQGAADFMASHRINAVLVDGNLDDGSSFEGIAFMGKEGEVGEVRFGDGKLLEVEIEELERRLAVAGFVNNVVRPVQRAAAAVYEEGSDLLDERFDVLPGFES